MLPFWYVTHRSSEWNTSSDPQRRPIFISEYILLDVLNTYKHSMVKFWIIHQNQYSVFLAKGKVTRQVTRAVIKECFRKWNKKWLWKYTFANTLRMFRSWVNTPRVHVFQLQVSLSCKHQKPELLEDHCFHRNYRLLQLSALI